MTRDWKRWGMRLKKLREARGYTQEALAQKVEVSRNTIARLEIGNRRPSLDLLQRLAKALKIKEGDLLK